MDKFEAFESEYRTGRTKPPKSYGAVIAVLMILVIFLGGIASLMGIMNVRLIRELNREKEANAAAVAFEQTQEQLAQEPMPAAAGKAGLGICSRELSDFCLEYYDMPQGLYVTDTLRVTGIEPGDILISVNGTHIPDQQTLYSLLEQHQVGDTVTVTVSRDHIRQQLEVVLMEEE